MVGAIFSILFGGGSTAMATGKYFSLLFLLVPLTVWCLMQSLASPFGLEALVWTISEGFLSLFAFCMLLSLILFTTAW